MLVCICGRNPSVTKTSVQSSKYINDFAVKTLWTMTQLKDYLNLAGSGTELLKLGKPGPWSLRNHSLICASMTENGTKWKGNKINHCKCCSLDEHPQLLIRCFRSTVFPLELSYSDNAAHNLSPITVCIGWYLRTRPPSLLTACSLWAIVQWKCLSYLSLYCLSL